MKRLLLITLCLGLLLHSSLTAYAVVDSKYPYEDYADALAGLGVFVGTGNGYELDRAPTRTEGLIMLIRLIGAENEAKSMQGTSTPFNDVPSWASGYIAYAYKEGLTKGISSSTFGSNERLDAKAYITFLLRSLDYDDLRGDFSYDNAISFAQRIGLIDSLLQNTILSNSFLRAHVAKLSYNALLFPRKDSQILLLDSLAQSGAIGIASISEFKSNLIIEPATISQKNYELRLILDMVLDDLKAIEIGLADLKIAAISRGYSDYNGYLEMVEYFEQGKQAFISQAGSDKTRYVLLNSILSSSYDTEIKFKLDYTASILNSVSLCTLELGNCVTLCDKYIRSNDSEDYSKLVVNIDSTLGKLAKVRNEILNFTNSLND